MGFFLKLKYSENYLKKFVIPGSNDDVNIGTVITQSKRQACSDFRFSYQGSP